MEGEVLDLEVEDVEEVVHFVEGDVVMVANQGDIMIMVNLWHHQYRVGVSCVIYDTIKPKTKVLLFLLDFFCSFAYKRI